MSPGSDAITARGQSDIFCGKIRHLRHHRSQFHRGRRLQISSFTKNKIASKKRTQTSQARSDGRLSTLLAKTGLPDNIGGIPGSGTVMPPMPQAFPGSLLTQRILLRARIDAMAGSRPTTSVPA